MDQTTYAATFALLVAIAAAGAWSAGHALFSWYSHRVICALKRQGWTTSNVWVLHVFAALALLGLFAHNEDDDATAERLANGVYGATVIRCYQMSDVELAVNETLCRDALGRVRN